MLPLTLVNNPNLTSFINGTQGIDRIAADIGYCTKEKI